MAAPLTKTTARGIVYTRPPDVQAQIDEAALLSPADLKLRLDVTKPERDGFLRHEALVHLLRKGIATGSIATFAAILPVLLKRCEKTLEGKIFKSLPAAHELREDILGAFAELLATDGAGDVPDELDFFECRFNLAFRTFWIDRANREGTHSGRLTAVDTEEELDEALADEECLKDISDSLHHDTPEARLSLQQLLGAIDTLPEKERDAVVLVKIMGFKEESNDPDEETAATKCKCTGRTIRNRLASAAVKLARFQENQ
jgi:hypothetical protein